MSNPVEGDLPSFDHATGWLNSAPLHAADLRGKVVLVDFWTYTCINWRRTLPWLRAWADTYRDAGLVVVGVHTPEFSFEEDIGNVRREAGAQRVDYPIVLDSRYAIWRAFDNHYWPALYLVDAHGRIRHHQFGEGDYDQLELLIRQLLTDAGAGPLPPPAGTHLVAGAEAAADWETLRSTETYFGHGRSQTFASPEIAFLGRPRRYSSPARLGPNQWALAGEWRIENESVHATGAGNRIAYRFHARDIHLVMGPGSGGKALRYRVTIDGKTPGQAHGEDIDALGNGVVDAPRMYQLIRQSQPIESRTFEIEFLDPGAEVFVVTFG